MTIRHKYKKSIIYEENVKFLYIFLFYLSEMRQN